MKLDNELHVELTDNSVVLPCALPISLTNPTYKQLYACSTRISIWGTCKYGIL